MAKILAKNTADDIAWLEKSLERLGDEIAVTVVSTKRNPATHAAYYKVLAGDRDLTRIVARIAGMRVRLSKNDEAIVGGYGFSKPDALIQSIRDMLEEAGSSFKDHPSLRWYRLI